MTLSNTQPVPDPFLSQKFRFWAFMSMFLLVFVHGYNLHERYMQPWTTPSDPFTFTTFIQYFLANGIFRFRIPMLFIISGYLFAMHDYRPYGVRTRKRLRTLLLPYLLWSAIAILFTYSLELFPFTREVVAASNIVRIDDTRVLLHEYSWYELLGRWILLPVAYQLWFIRVLLIYNIAYPLIRWCVVHPKGRWIFFSIAMLMWLGTMGAVLVEGEGILFFSLGVWMQKSGFDIAKPRRWLNPVAWGIVFLGLAAAKTTLAFTALPWLGDATYPLITVMHKMVIFSGLVCMWFGMDRLVKWCMSKPWFVWLTAFAFMIYALHAPLIAYLTDAVFPYISQLPFHRLIAFILLPLIVIAASVGFGALLRRFLPRVYGILTGGRGFQQL